MEGYFYPQGGTSILQGRGVGGGAWTSHQFGGKIWGKVRPSSPNKRKNVGSSATTRRKSRGKIPILGPYLKFRGQNLGYLSPIFLEAKFGAPTRISEANFGAKPPPRPPGMEVPAGLLSFNSFKYCIKLCLCFVLKLDQLYLLIFQ